MKTGLEQRVVSNAASKCALMSTENTTTHFVESLRYIQSHGPTITLPGRLSAVAPQIELDRAVRALGFARGIKGMNIELTPLVTTIDDLIEQSLRGRELFRVSDGEPVGRYNRMVGKDLVIVTGPPQRGYRPEALEVAVGGR